MTTYTPTHVQGPRTWKGQYGENDDFTLTIPDVDKPVIVTQRAGGTPIRSGEPIELEIGPHPRFDDKLKGKRPQVGGGFGGSRPEDPVRAKRILRQHSQDMAMRALTHALALGLVEPPKDAKALFELISKTADWFDKDAEGAAK